LLRGLVGPVTGFAVLLGLGGAWATQSIVEAVNDRLLGASARAVAETLAVEDGQIVLDLPPWALGMLENTSRDNIYYNVHSGDQLVTGYPNLPPPSEATLTDQETVFRYGQYRGQRVRIAAEARRLPRNENLVIVQVAETLEARHALSQRMLIQLVLLELAILALASLLVPIAVRWGLAPLRRLRRGMDARNAGDFTPLPLADVPRELRDLVTAFNALLGRLDQAVEGMRRFTADASHQMRTPLSILRTHIGVVKKTPIEDPKALESLADIEAATDRLQRLLTQLLALARAEGTGSGQSLTSVDIGSVARQVAESHALPALRAEIDLRFILEDSEPFLASSDPVLAAELISNLIDNAICYNRAGGTVTIRVIRAAEGGEERVVVAIEDDGPGIPEAERETIFTRFRRLERDQHRPGTGLGLSIVKAIAHVLHAEITLGDGSEHRGLLVRVAFPVTWEQETRIRAGLAGK
jgi:two-component system sensor histidine kinase TctE